MVDYPAGEADRAMTAPGEPEAREAVDTAPDERAERIARLEEQLTRTLADLDNVRRRAARQAEQVREQERAAVAEQWLPVLDNLDLALTHAQADPAAIVAGVTAVRDQALGILERLGYPRREDIGEPFDPARHEAAGEVTTAGRPPGVVAGVVRPGYGDRGHQLRPATVLVTRTRDGDES